MAKIIDGNWVELPRGGFLTNTSEGLVQLGCPPETIKDSIEIYGQIARIFLLSKTFFSLEKFISLAELEFPIYYNFFFLQQKTIIVCHKDYQKRFAELISSSLFGPPTYNLQQDYLSKDLPDLKKEGAYFVNFSLEEVVEFRTYTYDKEIKIGNITIKGEQDAINIKDQEKNSTLILPNHLSYKVEKNQIYNPNSFNYPKFGISCLGSSHGFDSKGHTSGFIFWINHKAIIVDPIVETPEWLFANNVDYSSITGIILTHTHADHDVGILRLLFENQGRRLKLYTTKTILKIWLKKYSIVTGISERDLESFFDFQQIIIGKEFAIEDESKFEFHYTLHSIPTIGFHIFYKGISFTYSSDHLNDPKYYRELLDRKIIDEKRFAELSNFKWDSTIIYHESGIPPLHTSIDYLNSLPTEIKKKIRVYHISKNDFQVSNSKFLRLAEEGKTETFLDDSKDISVKKQILNENFYLKEITIKDCKTIYKESQEITYKQGETIDPKDLKNTFFVILSGFIEAKENNTVLKLGLSNILGCGNFIKQIQNYKEINCLTNVVVLKVPIKSLLPFIDKNKITNLQNLITNTKMGFPKYFEKVNQETPLLLNTHLFTKELQVLQSYFSFETLEEGEIFSTKDYYYIHCSGSYELVKQPKEVIISQDISLFLTGLKNTQELSYRTLTTCRLFKIPKNDFKYCCKLYPKFAFKFLLQK